MVKKYHPQYVRIKNKSGGSRQVPIGRNIKRKINPLRRSIMLPNKEGEMVLVKRKTRRRSNVSCGKSKPSPVNA